MECDDGDVDLLPGYEGVRSGHIQVCVNKRWAMMCTGSGSTHAHVATTVCRQLGYQSGRFLIKVIIRLFYY